MKARVKAGATAGMKAIEVEIDGKLVRGFAADAGGVLWAHVNGETFVYEPPKPGARRGRAGASAGDPGRITSPMPGKIVKVHAKAGETVEAGGALVTLEAMKMEYALKAQAAGQVREVRCQAGDQVTLGQVLVLLELAEKAGS